MCSSVYIYTRYKLQVEIRKDDSLSIDFPNLVSIIPLDIFCLIWIKHVLNHLFESKREQGQSIPVGLESGRRCLPTHVCLQSNVSFAFPICRTRLLSFGPQCACRCKSGSTLRPIDADVPKDSLCTPQGLVNDRSLLLRRVSRRVGDAAMNCKCETTDLPAMQTPWCIIAHLGIQYVPTAQSSVSLHNKQSFPENAHSVKTVTKQSICSENRDRKCSCWEHVVTRNLCICSKEPAWTLTLLCNE